MPKRTQQPARMQRFESAFPWWLACGPLLVLPAAALLLTPTAWPRWALMWLLALSIYAGCKWLRLCSAHVNGAPPWRRAAYLLLWPGMDATALLSPSIETGPPSQGVLDVRDHLTTWWLKLGYHDFAAV